MFVKKLRQWRNGLALSYCMPSSASEASRTEISLLHHCACALVVRVAPHFLAQHFIHGENRFTSLEAKQPGAAHRLQHDLDLMYRERQMRYVCT